MEAASITAGYCQSSAHSRIVQPLCQLGCWSVQSRRLKPLGSAGGIPHLPQVPKLCLLPPHSRACAELSVTLSALRGSPGPQHHLQTQSHQEPAGLAKAVSIMHALGSFSTQQVKLKP